MESVEPIRSKAQIDAMKKILKHDSLRDYCLFVLGINSGLRVSDLLALHIEDVADERGKPLDRIVLREKKTGKAKDFPLSASAQKAIREYLDTRSIRLQDPLFTSRTNGYTLQRNAAYVIINRAARAVGITDRIGTHTLRKTFGYHAYMMGVDITRIQKLLNHSSPGVTMAYIGITKDELDNVYMALDL